MTSRSIKKRTRIRRTKDARTGQVRETEVEYWRARYRDDVGKEHARHFDRKVDAQHWLDEVTASIVTSTYVDPKAGRITFGRYFEELAGRQVWESGTMTAMRLAADSATFRDVQMRALRRSHGEQWVKAMLTAPRGKGGSAWHQGRSGPDSTTRARCYGRRSGTASSPRIRSRASHCRASAGQRWQSRCRPPGK